MYISHNSEVVVKKSITVVAAYSIIAQRSCASWVKKNVRHKVLTQHPFHQSRSDGNTGTSFKE